MANPKTAPNPISTFLANVSSAPSTATYDLGAVTQQALELSSKLVSAAASGAPQDMVPALLTVLAKANAPVAITDLIKALGGDISAATLSVGRAKLAGFIETATQNGAELLALTSMGREVARMVK